MLQRLIVTHHAPDLDAICSTWLLKTFDAQKYADAKVAFVNPGDTISQEKLADVEIEKTAVTHVDTGLGEFDHHQKERGQKRVCASSLVYDYLCQHYPDKKRDEALQIIVEFVTQIDHFEEIFWPDASNYRYSFMIQELIAGLEHLAYHNDESQLHFGMTCLDSVYQVIKNQIQAKTEIVSKGEEFYLKKLKCLAISSNNDAVIKLAQKQGFALVVRKDPDEGNIRIKARPDTNISLESAYQQITQIDPQADWYFHPGGKMLLNGSSKKTHLPSSLSLAQTIEILEKIYG